MVILSLLWVVSKPALVKISVPHSKCPLLLGVALSPMLMELSSVDGVSLETEWMQGMNGCRDWMDAGAVFAAPTLCMCYDQSHRMTLQLPYPQSGLHALLRTISDVSHGPCHLRRVHGLLYFWRGLMTLSVPMSITFKYLNPLSKTSPQLLIQFDFTEEALIPSKWPFPHLFLKMQVYLLLYCRW